jgi:predicted transcriptional regulator
MTAAFFNELSMRERQIMDIVYRLESATATQVRENLPDELSDAGVRTLLRVLVRKNQLRIKKIGRQFLYLPVVPRRKARQSALNHLRKTFFNNKPEELMAACLRTSELTPEELDRIEAMINELRQQ